LNQNTQLWTKRNRKRRLCMES